MWWLAAADLYRSALSGDQLILVVKRVCSRVQSQLRIGLSICWLPTYDGTFQGDLSAPPHIQKGCCGLARRTVCEHTLPQRFCVGTFWTRQHVIPALRKKRSELRLRRRVKPFFFGSVNWQGLFWQHMFFFVVVALHTRMVWGYRTRLTAPKARAIHWLHNLLSPPSLDSNV